MKKLRRGEDSVRTNSLLSKSSLKTAQDAHDAKEVKDVKDVKDAKVNQSGTSLNSRCSSSMSEFSSEI